MTEYPAELPQNLQAYLAEHKGLTSYYLSERACLQMRYGVTEHKERQNDEGYADGILLEAFGRTYIQRGETWTEERLPTSVERDAERERLRAAAEQAREHRRKLEEMAASGDADARAELRFLQAGDDHQRDLERAMLFGRVW